MLKTHPKRLLPIVVATVACALALAACGSSKSPSSEEGASGETLSTAQTKAAIEESILKERHLHAVVICPTTVVKEKGVTFQCVAKVPNGSETVFHVVEVNKLGRVEYSSPPITTTTTKTKTKTGHT